MIRATLILFLVWHIVGTAASWDFIHVGVVWPLTSPPYLTQTLDHGYVATQMAFADLNAQNEILPNATWIPRFRDDTFQSTRAFFATMDLCGYCAGESTLKCNVSLLSGPASADSTGSVLQVATEFYTPLIIGTSGGVGFGDKIKYPTFARTQPDDGQQLACLVAVCKFFNWKTVGVLAIDSVQGSETSNAFIPRAIEEGIEVRLAHTINVGLSAEDISNAITAMKSSGVRIILWAGQLPEANIVWPQALREGLMGPPYVWLATSAVVNPSLATSAAGPASFGAIGTQPAINRTTSEYQSFVAKWQAMYRADNSSTRFIANPVIPFTFFQYDAIMLAARGLHAFKKLQDECAINATVDATRCPGALAGINSKIGVDVFMGFVSNNMQFEGTSGHVSMVNGERQGTFNIWNIREGGVQGLVGTYSQSPTGEDLVSIDVNLMRWPDNTTNVPVSQPRIVDQIKPLSAGPKAAMDGLAGIGLVYATTCLVGNLAFRKRKLIKMSSPIINACGVVGCMILYISFFFMGQSSAHIGVSKFEAFCNLRLWMFAIGFTLGFGSLFSKTYRIYHIFRKQAKLQTVKITDAQLLIVLGLMLAGDALLLVIWTSLDPLRLSTKFLQMERESVDVTIRWSTEACRSERMELWLILIFVLKGVLLVFGSWLSVEIRSVQIKALNDSGLVAVSIYTTAIVCAMLVPLTFVLDDQLANFIFTTVCIWLLVTAYLSIMFMPKFVALAKGTDTVYALGTGPMEQSAKDLTHASKRRPSVGNSGISEHNNEAETAALVHPSGRSTPPQKDKAATTPNRRIIVRPPSVNGLNGGGNGNGTAPARSRAASFVFPAPPTNDGVSKTSPASAVGVPARDDE